MPRARDVDPARVVRVKSKPAVAAVGTPTCNELARDISMGDATKRDCVFFSKERLRDLQRAYLCRDDDV